MSTSPTLETGRLTLRQVREHDVQDIFEYARNPSVLRYTTAETPTHAEQTMVFVMDAVHKPEGAYAWAMCLRGMDQVIGVIEFAVQGTVGSVDYAMAEPYWNRGLMTEAVGAVLKWGFAAHPAMMEVRSTAHVENTASRRVMEKCGMEHARTVQERWKKLATPVTLAVYSIHRGRHMEMFGGERKIED